MKKLIKLVQNNRGYSLVELLTVAIILVIVSTVIAGIITSTLRGTSKSKITNIVSQNGTYAITVMSGIIRSSISVLDVGGTDLTTMPEKCEVELTGKSITLQHQDFGVTTLSCIDIDPADSEISGIYSHIASNSSSLTDNTSVEVIDCQFTCRQNTGRYSAPLIEVDFKLKQPGASSDHIDSVVVPYKSQVLMRNFVP